MYQHFQSIVLNATKHHILETPHPLIVVKYTIAQATYFIVICRARLRFQMIVIRSAEQVELKPIVRRTAERGMK